MIGGLLLLVLSALLVAFAGINLANCIGNGRASAYGHSYSRVENPVGFWVSATCSVLAVLFGLAMAVVAVAGLIGLV
jgi:Na+-transporting NADH:ubiquinone oxidoreductase subunit NqrD